MIKSTNKQKKNILVVYRTAQFPLRSTTHEHLYSFKRYSGCRVYYLNLALFGVPSYIKKTHFDLIVFDTIFTTNHWDPVKFKDLMDRAQPLKKINAIKVAMPQDEFINTDLLCDFINDFNINCVFSVAPKTEWANIYHKVDFSRVKFFNVLTGYLDEKAAQRMEKLSAEVANRDIDIGYRAPSSPLPWFGSHGYLKQQIVEVMLERTKGHNIVTDISMSQKDSFLGDDWYRFLLRCKYTIGVEGGTSILDRDGSIKNRTERYLREHPGAGFNELENNCFPGMDNNFKLFAISPRHIEACLTNTCQILIEGEYNGILKSGVHYISLKKDFSNVEEVIKMVIDDKKRNEIIYNAFRDIVSSGRYTYRSFVDFVIKESLSETSANESSGIKNLVSNFAYYLTWLREMISWTVIALGSSLIKRARGAYAAGKAR